MRVPLLVLLLALPIAAQPAVVPEIRGTVVEAGTTTPIPGADVAIYEFGPNAENFIVKKTLVSTTTDTNGVFSLKPGRFGEFSIAATKAGYDDRLSARSQTLNSANPVGNIQLVLTLPGSLTGRVVDPQGNPVPNQRVVFSQRVAYEGTTTRFPGTLSAVTNAEGIFTATMLAPGPYVVQVALTPVRDDEELMPFTEEAFQIVDEDVEPSYWPGGVSDPDLVLPITVSGGAIANVGTITIRKVPYYRVRVTNTSDCAPNERWILRLRPAAEAETPIMDRYAACQKDFLLTRVPPGTYALGVWPGREVEKWALAPIVITKENTSATLNFQAGAAVSGQIKAVEGVDRTKLGDLQILLRSGSGLPNPQSTPSVDASGKLTFDRVPWTTQWLSVQPKNPETYVKEIRYNGLPLRSHQLESVSTGSTLDIVLDSGAASLNVTLKRGEAPANGRALLIAATLAEPPRSFGQFPPFTIGYSGNPFSPTNLIRNIPPGDYRLVILPPTYDFTDPNVIATLFAQAEKVTLGRGEQKSIEIKVK